MRNIQIRLNSTSFKNLLQKINKISVSVTYLLYLATYAISYSLCCLIDMKVNKLRVLN